MVHYSDMKTNIAPGSLRLMTEMSPALSTISVRGGQVKNERNIPFANSSLRTAGVFFQPMTWIRWMVVGLVPVLLVSCGGGDSDSETTDPMAGPYAFEVFTLAEEGIAID